MAAKYGKARDRESKRVDSLLRATSAEESRQTYYPPSRDEQDQNEWVNYHEEFRILYYTWNDPATKRLVDFKISLHINHGHEFEAGPAIASADCTIHGSCHMHDETSPAKRDERHEILPLTCRGDLDVAFDLVVDKLVPFGRMIIKAGRDQND